MEAALNKASTKKPAAPQATTALASKSDPKPSKPAASESTEKPKEGEDSVSGEAYQRALASIETKEDKLAKIKTPIVVPTEQAQE